MMKIFYFSQVSSLFVFNLISNLLLQPVRDHFKEDAHAKDLLKRVKVFELEYLPRFSNGWCLLPIITFSIIGTSNCCAYAGMCVYCTSIYTSSYAGFQGNQIVWNGERTPPHAWSCSFLEMGL